jgi:hypothetical protein
MLSEFKWQPYKVLQLEVKGVKLNHLIINLITRAINKIDQTGAITITAFDANLAHYKQYTSPMWATKKGNLDFGVYVKYMVRLQLLMSTFSFSSH